MPLPLFLNPKAKPNTVYHNNGPNPEPEPQNQKETKPNTAFFADPKWWIEKVKFTTVWKSLNNCFGENQVFLIEYLSFFHVLISLPPSPHFIRFN